MIKLTIEKVVTETGDKGYKLLSFEGIIKTFLLYRDGPLKYCIDVCGNNLDIYIKEERRCIKWTKNTIITQKEFEEFINLLKKAGEELHEFNKHKKELESQHHGTFEVYI